MMIDFEKINIGLNSMSKCFSPHDLAFMERVKKIEVISEKQEKWALQLCGRVDAINDFAIVKQEI